MVFGVADRKEMLKKIAEMRKKQKQKKMGTPKFAPGKGGGSDAARKGKGTIKKKPVPFKPKNGKQPERGKMAKGGRPGLYANIHAKRKSGRRMKKKGEKGAPTAANFRRAAQTARTR
jgi:hypothetical protein